MTVHRLVQYSVIAVLATGCSTTALKVNPVDYSVQQMQKASYTPTPEEVKREKPRVAIFPLELYRGNNELSASEAEALESAMRSELEAALLDSGKVKLLDRTLALRLRGALAEYERTGKTPSPFKQADALVITNIDLTTADREYQPPSKNSKGKVIPGVCITSARVSGVLKVYDILENDTIGIEKIDGSAIDYEEAPRCAALQVLEERAIFQRASKKAAERARSFIRTFFAPKGFVVEKRSNGKAWVFKVTTDGEAMSEYKTVKIFNQRRSENALTGELESETLAVGTALVTDQVGERFLWIYVDDPKVADQVRVGHLVKPDSLGFNPINLLKEKLL